MQQQQRRRLFSPKKETTADRIDQHIEIACPSSIVLPSLEQHFRVHGDVLELFVPGQDRAGPEALALIRNIIVEIAAHPNKSLLGRFDDRLDIRWHSALDLRLSFAGRFTIKPLSAGTELTLKGRYEPPFVALEAKFRPLLAGSAAEAIGRMLLERLKSILEIQFGTYRDLGHKATSGYNGR